MRKILLASAAILGATGGIAFAQSNPNQGQVVAPWAAGPAANNNNNALGRAAPGATAVPTPGTVVIRFNGRVQADVTAGWDTGDRPTGSPNKLNPIGISSYMRLYPGIDGMATNGLRYGASIELRENFPSSSATAGQTTPTLATAPSPSTYSSGETVFVRRAFTYIGSDQMGIIRLGQTDGVIGLFDGGVFTSATWDGGVGSFNGGTAQVNGANVGSSVPFAWLSQAGAEYSNSKIVYLTPQFAGFDFGVQYAPSMGNGNGNCAANTVAAGFGCNGISTGADSSRWINQVAAGVRYQGTFGAVAVKAMAVYETAGKESVAGNGVLATGAGTFATATTSAVRYDNLSFVNAAAAISVAGFTFAADYIGGALNGQLAMRPTGGAPENAVVTGVTYQNGPWIFGLEAAWVDSQGSTQLTKVTQRHEWEIAFGGTYTIAPGMALVGEFMHTERHQGGFDFSTNAVGATAGGGTRNGQANKLLVSTVVTW